jgi:hypothetical protein
MLNQQEIKLCGRDSFSAESPEHQMMRKSKGKEIPKMLNQHAGNQIIRKSTGNKISIMLNLQERNCTLYNE